MYMWEFSLIENIFPEPDIGSMHYYIASTYAKKPETVFLRQASLCYFLLLDFIAFARNSFSRFIASEPNDFT